MYMGYSARIYVAISYLIVYFDKRLNAFLSRSDVATTYCGTNHVRPAPHSKDVGHCSRLLHSREASSSRSAVRTLTERGTRLDLSSFRRGGHVYSIPSRSNADARAIKFEARLKKRMN